MKCVLIYKKHLIHKGGFLVGILYMIHAVLNIYQQGYNTIYSMSAFCSITHCVAIHISN